MDCNQAKILIDAFIDNELDLTNSIEIERHISICQSCSTIFQNYQVLRSALGNEAIYYTPPSDLKKKIVASIKSTEKRPFEFKSRIFGWQGATTSFALATVVLIIFILFKSLPTTETEITEQIVNNHMRSLMPNHLTDVQNSDQHTVKPWFNGKLDFSPPVEDLTTKSFILVGGRLDYINGQPVAAIVYQRKAHYINLFFWFSDNQGDINKKISVTRGYNIIHWIKGNKNYWAVSDINLTELDEFVIDFQETQ